MYKKKKVDLVRYPMQLSDWLNCLAQIPIFSKAAGQNLEWTVLMIYDLSRIGTSDLHNFNEWVGPKMSN